MRQRDREPLGSDQRGLLDEDGDAGYGAGYSDANYSDRYGLSGRPTHPDFQHRAVRRPAAEYDSRHEGQHGPQHDAHPEPHDWSGSLLDDYDSAEDDEGHIPRVRVSRRDDRSTGGRHGRHGRGRRGRSHRLAIVLGSIFVVVLALVAWLVVLPIYHYLSPSDYSGSGSGTVIVTVHADDGARQIGDTLHGHDVVASVGAFTNAAADNAKSQGIQPGSYRLRKRMSAGSALNLLLDPSSRVNADIVVPEGATSLDVEKRLTVPACSDTTNASASCGPGLTRAQVQQAFGQVGSLGLPTDYLVGGKPPKSIEGFLFPATYYFPGKTSASDALTQMISKFADEARGIDFTASATALHISPYQELIIASLAQSEAKYASDYPKVARVILNRLVAHKPLQIDAATRYGAILDGKDPSKVTYSNYDTPYNTYLHTGLPPTPIDNPGTEAMTGVAHPASGDLMYYVNGDAQGHLVFLRTAAEFEKARQRCAANNWGCAN